MASGTRGRAPIGDNIVGMLQYFFSEKVGPGGFPHHIKHVGPTGKITVMNEHVPRYAQQPVTVVTPMTTTSFMFAYPHNELPTTARITPDGVIEVTVVSLKRVKSGISTMHPRVGIKGAIKDDDPRREWICQQAAALFAKYTNWPAASSYTTECSEDGVVFKIVPIHDA